MKRKLSILLSLVMLFSMIFNANVMAAEMYTVQSGDVLWKIAEQYGTTWESLAEINNLENPHLIFPGQVLNVSGEAAVEEPVATDKTITLLATSDLHGRIYPYEYAIDSEDSDAGIAKIATLIKAERAVNDNVVLMDLGDTVQDNSAELFNNFDIHPMIEALNMLDYDTWTLGNHEFNFQKSFLENNIATFEGATLAANIRNISDDDYYVEPYTIIEKDGIRVAVVGVLPPHVDTWESAAPEHFEGMYFTDPVKEARTAVDALEGKYDVLVGAIHIGPDGEYDFEGGKAIAEACPEFDVIFMGHKHDMIDNLEVNGVQLVEPGKYGAYLAKAEIGLKGNEVVSVTAENIGTKSVEADQEILDYFAFVHEQSIADSNVVVGQVTADYVEGVDYITGESVMTTMPTTKMEDTALIDLINDVQLFYTGADFSSAAAFNDNMNLTEGDFKKKDVAFIYKYANTLNGVNITGANLKAYMEWSASFYNTYVPGDVTISFNQDVRGYNYDMFAGMTYDIDISKPAGERITNLMTADGSEIMDDQVYKLAVNNYRFGTLLNLELITNEDKYYDSYEEMQDAGRIRDLIIKYISEEKGGMATPTVDNNWKIIGADLEHELKDEIMDLIKSGEIVIPKTSDGRTPNIKSINVYDVIEDGYFPDYEVINFLHTNDVHGFYKEGKYDGMGAAKMMTFIQDFKANNDNVLLVDAGDALQGHNFVTLSKGENGVEVMNAMGYDVMTVGNHEFDYGKDRTLELVEMADFPVLGGNILVDADGSRFLEGVKLYEFNGIKVAVVGISTPETTYKSHPDNTVGLSFQDPVEAYAELVEGVEADVFVGLVHLGIEDNPTSTYLAQNAVGLDVIIDGHSHTKLSSGLMENGVLIGQADEKSKNIGVIRIAVKDDEIVSKGATLFTKAEAADLIEDPDMMALVEELSAANAVIENEEVAVAPFVLNGEKDYVRTGETNLGNLLATALMVESGADLALTNGGGIRSSIDEGVVTKGEILNVLPFGNTVRIIELTGADVIAAIENGITDYPVSKGAFPHIAGMTVTFDSTKEAGSRVVEILVDGVAIDEAATYTLATNDFLVAGGDAYTMFKGKNVVGELGAMDEVLIEYMNEEGFDAAVEDGRIKDVANMTSMIIIDYLMAA